MAELDDEFGASFGELLRHHRSAAGLTQEGLAVRVGLSPRSIFDLERGDSRPHLDNAERLARALLLSGSSRSHFLDASRRGRRRAAGRGPASPGAVASVWLANPESQRFGDGRHLPLDEALQAAIEALQRLASSGGADTAPPREAHREGASSALPGHAG